MTLEIIISYLYDALMLTIPLFFVWGCWRAAYIRRSQKKMVRYEEVSLWIFIFYLLCLYMITVFRAELNVSRILEGTHSYEQINLIPFVELQKLWSYGYFWSFSYNVFGNIVWFLPFGFLIPIIRKEISGRSVVWYGMMVSTSIELLQFILITGITDIDDVFFNTLGTAIGYGIFKMIAKIYEK